MSCICVFLEQFDKNKYVKFIDKFIKKNKSKYSLIISGVAFCFSKKIRKSNNFIFVQHTDYTLFDRIYFYSKLNFGKHDFLYKKILLISAGSFFTNKNILKITKNVVFFSDDKKYKEINKNPLIGSIPMELNFLNKENDWYINNKNNNSILYFGRFDNTSKNLNLLSNIAIKGNFNIDLYGHGEYVNELKKNYLLNFKGKINSVNDKINILSKYDIFILTSNYEGLPIASIELLSMGIIGIIRNSFLEAKNIIPKQYHDFLLINFDASVDEYIEKINYIKNMPKKQKNEIRINLINHIKNKYSSKHFENNWKLILKKINLNSD